MHPIYKFYIVDGDPYIVERIRAEANWFSVLGETPVIQESPPAGIPCRCWGFVRADSVESALTKIHANGLFNKAFFFECALESNQHEQ
jgi:hypothetical protein